MEFESACDVITAFDKTEYFTEMTETLFSGFGCRTFIHIFWRNSCTFPSDHEIMISRVYLHAFQFKVLDLKMVLHKQLEEL